MIILDTSLLVDCITGPKRSAPAVLRLLEDGQRLVVPSLVIYEWLRGPRSKVEIEDQETLFPAAESLQFDAQDAVLSAELYRSVRRARSREIDIAIAACAIRNDAELWTLNTSDFKDIPGLQLLADR